MSPSIQHAADEASDAFTRSTRGELNVFDTYRKAKDACGEASGPQQALSTPEVEGPLDALAGDVASAVTSGQDGVRW